MAEEKKTWRQESQENAQKALDQFKEKYKGMTIDEAEALIDRERKAEIAARMEAQRKESK